MRIKRSPLILESQGLPGKWKLFPVERLLVGAYCVLLVLSAAGGSRGLSVAPHLAIGLAVLFAGAGLLDPASGPVARWLRELLPLPLVLNIFQSLGKVITSVRATTYDPLLIASDRALLGHRLSSAIWTTTLPWPVTDLLTLAYTTFYVMPLVLFLWMVARHHPHRQWVITALLATLLISYAGYVFVPAFGPRATVAADFYRSLPNGVVGGPIRHLLDTLEKTKVDAFPSGHVMITLLTLVFVQRYRPSWLWIYLPVASLLVAATVLLAYHYLTDVIAGAFLVPAGPLLARLLFPGLAESPGVRAVPSAAGLGQTADSRTAPPPRD